MEQKQLLKYPKMYLIETRMEENLKSNWISPGQTETVVETLNFCLQEFGYDKTMELIHKYGLQDSVFFFNNKQQIAFK